MTIRKSPVTVGGPSTSALPYPLSPTSSSQPNSQNSGFELTGTGSTIWQSDREIHNAEHEKDCTSGTGGTRFDTQPPSRVDGDSSTKNATANSDSLPRSLQIRPAEVTPRSSFDSQRSKRSTSPTPADANDIGEERPPTKLASNNPFLHQIDNPAPISAHPASEQSSAGIWANRPEDHPWYTQNGHNTISITPEPSTASKVTSNNISTATLQPNLSETINPAFPETPSRPVTDMPFEDPWYDASTSQPPLTQLHPKGRGMEASQSDFLERTESHQNTYNHAANEGLISELPNDGESEKELPPLPPRNQRETAPGLPPRPVDPVSDNPPPRPPRPGVDTSIGGGDVSSKAQTELDRRKKQRSETYQIRLVNWFDASSSTNPRRSPIMVQNANGPCPLLALVNALVLSTPSGLETALLDTLERREQVSLGLLLDAVIDELMSGRRGDAAQNLPDVSDLYAFLVNLHTGMNVNPIFAQNDAEAASKSDIGYAGGFESTREMKLYSTFAVPLIHGWIPSSSHTAQDALKRSAKTYEDAQNLMFAEEELENKLSRQGLNQDEQRLLQDIADVKFFLSSSATQLTGFGLSQIMESSRPGSIAILFRNDHFSTLYRHPRSGRLFTLVTDMGYAGHDEVVWESLVDISGEGSGFFAGDFRPVGNHNSNLESSTVDDDIGWTTVQRSKARDKSGGDIMGSDTAPDLSTLQLEDSSHHHTSPKAEQEDHDLALALQLQEEEEERERQEIAARRREDELSKTYLGSQASSRGHVAKHGAEVRPAIPPRNSNSGRDRGGMARGGPRGIRNRGANSTDTRASVQPEDGDDAPPPSYDQAASGPAYHPPPNHPAHPNAFSTSPTSSEHPQSGLQRQFSAYSQNSSGLADSPSASSPACSPSMTGSRRRTHRNPVAGRGGASGLEGGPGLYRHHEGRAMEGADRSRDCVLM